jgi:tRNA threonylcarbamoyladenosine biosynthesis protein TsaE
MSEPQTYPSTNALLCSRLVDSEEETVDLALNLARNLRAGDVVLLNGALGSGKTFFARALIQSRLTKIGAWEEVPSPSFTIVQEYDLGADVLWHVDLYRLSGPDDIYELGLIDAFETAVCLVEWPDRLGNLKPENAIILTIKDKGETSRLFDFTFPDTDRGHMLAAVMSGTALP